jgi:type II secretory pathway pseudopilin PulG
MRAYGVTLVELAVVLFILSLLLGGTMGALSARVETEERRRTAALLEEIRNALIGHAIVHGHLPCPDCRDAGGNCALAGLGIGDGVEDGIDASGNGVSPRSGETALQSCAVLTGFLPWATLGAPAMDAWGNPLSYRVSAEFARDVPERSVSFDLGSSGDIDVKIDPSSSGYAARELAAIVISHGRHGAPPAAPRSPAEQRNRNGHPPFIAGPYRTAEGGEFDDMLTWVSGNVLIYRMVQAGRLP